MSLINVTFISNTGSDLTGNNKSFGYQKEKKKISTTPLDPEHLKVKDIEQDINLTKNYYITISMQKISSIQKFNFKIQQILGSHKLKDLAYPKITEAIFSFLEFVASCKKSVYSICSFLRYSQF